MASLSGMTGPAGTGQISDDARSLISRTLEVTESIAEAARSAGRRPEEVRLLLATKMVPVQRIVPVLATGHLLIGESRVQEVLAKAEALASYQPEIHFIGHLQANKIGPLLPHIACLQTLDSVDLGRRVQARLARTGQVLDVLVQVNVSAEVTKSGVSFAELPRLLAGLTAFDRLKVRGYMTIGLNSSDMPAVRAGYRQLTDFRDQALAGGLPGTELATELSMGMSGDYVDAIAEGATIVRLGSAVFGARPLSWK